MATKANESLGELVSQATNQLSELVRKEFELARAEIAQEVGKAGRGAGMFGGAGLTAYLALLFLSLAGMFGLGEAMPLWAASLLVAAVYGVVTAGLFLSGRAAFGDISPVPRRTVRTLQEDAEWARHRNS